MPERQALRVQLVQLALRARRESPERQALWDPLGLPERLALWEPPGLPERLALRARPELPGQQVLREPPGLPERLALPVKPVQPEQPDLPERLALRARWVRLRAAVQLPTATVSQLPDQRTLQRLVAAVQSSAAVARPQTFPEKQFY